MTTLKTDNPHYSFLIQEPYTVVTVAIIVNSCNPIDWIKIKIYKYLPLRMTLIK